jgi:hypothetical protein
MAESLTLAEKVLLGAVECTQGSDAATFTAETLAVQAWMMDRNAFGLRGFENEYPDSNKIFKSIDSKGGLVSKALIAKVGDRTFRVTPAGFAKAAALRPTDDDLRKPDRGLASEVNKIISHPVFREWLTDSQKPTKFYAAGHFWGIAAGTPSKVIRDRLKHIEVTLSAALDYLERNRTETFWGDREQVIAERRDIERALEFNTTLKERFKEELTLLSSR